MSIEKMPQFTSPQETSGVEKREIEITQEQKEILESVEKFAEYLIARFPQVDENRRMVIEVDEKGTTVELPELPESIQTVPMLNYYVSGSLATMLLSRAEKFTEIDENQTHGVLERQTRSIPTGARHILATFARQIADLDYVPTDFYSGKKAHVQNSYNKVSEEELKRMRAPFLWKGNGIKFSEIPEEAVTCLKRNKTQVSVMVDPLQTYGAKRAAKVTVAGKEYFIARPDTIFAYKILHLLQSYEKNPENFNADFNKLFSAMKEMYSEEELLHMATQILTDYENAMEASHRRFYDGDDSKPYHPQIPTYVSKVLANPKLSLEIKTILEKLKK